MIHKILCVDDEENVLHAFERTLRSQYQLATAVGAIQGLATLADQGPFAVVVSDLRMPEMDGIQFLSEVRKRSPDTVRLILSGNADLKAVITAVNEGSIFQFLTKPCPAETLRVALDSALKQYQLITAERELLEGTLRGSIGMMTEILSVVNPLAFSRASRVRHYVRHMASELRLSGVWQFDLAAMLSQIGCIAVPTEVLQKVYAHMVLSKEEQETFASHPSIGHSLLTKIPRLGVVAEIVRHQMTPLRELRNPKIPEAVAIGARMLMLANYFEETVSRGTPLATAMTYIRSRPDLYEASLVSVLATVQIGAEKMETRAVSLPGLRAGMVVKEDMRLKSGLVLVMQGEELTEALIARVKNFARTAGIVEPFVVMTPVVEQMDAAPELKELIHG